MGSHSFGQPSEAFIDKLPNETLSYIFEYCQPFEGPYRMINSWVRFMRVCRRWHDVAERVLYTQMTLRIGGSLNAFANIVIEEPEIGSLVQSVEIWDFCWSSYGKQLTRNVLRSLKSVRSLTIPIGFSLSDKSFFRLLREMPLTEAKIMEFSRVDTIFEFYDIPTLKRLDLEKRFEAADFNDRDGGKSFSSVKSLDRVLPPSKQRTSTITNLRVWWPYVPLYVTERLLLWPANLEIAKLLWLPRGSLTSEYNFRSFWKILSSHAATLKSLEIGALPLADHDIPSFSYFSRLEKLNMYAGDLMGMDPEMAVRVLAAPKLERLILKCLKDFAWAPNALLCLEEHHYRWLKRFLCVIKSSGSIPELRIMQIDNVSLSPWAYDLEVPAKECRIRLVFIERRGLFGEDYSVICFE